MNNIIDPKSPRLRKRGDPRLTIPVSLYPDQVDALRKLGQENDVPYSVLIRHAIQRFLADHPEAGGE